jgi:hypothetical protein
MSTCHVQPEQHNCTVHQLSFCTVPLHCLPALSICTVRWHCPPALSTCTVHLPCLPALSTYPVHLCCLAKLYGRTVQRTVHCSVHLNGPLSPSCCTFYFPTSLSIWTCPPSFSPALSACTYHLHCPLSQSAYGCPAAVSTSSVHLYCSSALFTCTVYLHRSSAVTTCPAKKDEKCIVLKLLETSPVACGRPSKRLGIKVLQFLLKRNMKFFLPFLVIKYLAPNRIRIRMF